LTHPEDSFTLPINYNYYLTGLIYDVVSTSSTDYATFLHDEGYTDGETAKKFKLFTFSQLRFRQMRVEGDRIRSTSPRMDLYISSPVREFVEHLADGLLGKERFPIGREESFRAEEIEVLEPPEFNEEMKFICLSPLVASTVVEEEGELKTYYYRYSDDELSKAVASNLAQKYRLVHGEGIEPGRFRLQFDPDYVKRRNGRISKLVRYKNTKIKGIFAPFSVRGKPELIKVGYQAGFGEKGSMGFGMVAGAENSAD